MSIKLKEKIINKKEFGLFRELIYKIAEESDRILLRNDLLLIYDEFLKDRGSQIKLKDTSSVYLFIRKVQELFVSEDYIILMHRYDIARYRFYSFRIDTEVMEEITLEEYLNFKDEKVSGPLKPGKNLKIDYLPFYDYTPNIKNPEKIGHGINFLTRYLASGIFNSPEKWNDNLFNFLKLHKHNGQQILLNSSVIKDYESFYNSLENMLRWLKRKKGETKYDDVERQLRKFGFEPGWGDRVEDIVKSMQILLDLINEPSVEKLEEFISRVPMPLISKVVIVSPHGWFAQEKVLGKPDTGGQVIYILDQVRALEKHLQEEIRKSGLKLKPQIIVLTRLIPDAGDTTCNLRKEQIHDTDNCWILRLPFKDGENNDLRQWVSRFNIWPYLDRFAFDAVPEIRGEMQGRPDLIIGNYSDGNLVASLIAEKMNVIQCSIAHALEKTKYLFSDLYWKDFEENYNFSMHFTADMIAMNRSDFIIASTHQEIIGTEDTMGQYESYQFFTMPGLMQVKGGVNLFAPKFNVIPPGVDEKVYFPYYERENRIEMKREKWENRLFRDSTADIFGTLDDPSLPPIFTMARFDRIKNITGLIEAFGLSGILKSNFNLIFAAGTIDPMASSDHEERNEINKAYELISRYKLEGRVRWLPSVNKIDTGEVYRIIADYKGIFVQPALFEAFGLTILEAMLSGLPTFGPVFGGPSEIIEHGKSGYLINTSKPELIAKALEEYCRDNLKHKDLWQNVSEAGVSRVRENYTWKLYSSSLIKQTKLYGFWRFSVAEKGKEEMDRYSDVLYHFLFKERTKRLKH